MIGCIARATTFEVARDDESGGRALVFARGSPRHVREAPPGRNHIPERMAIAHHLLKFWLES